MHSPEGLRFKLSLTLSAHVPEGYGIVILSFIHSVMKSLQQQLSKMATSQALKLCTHRELDKVSPFNVPDFLFSALFS